MKKIIEKYYDVHIKKIYNDFFFYNDDKIIIVKMKINDKNKIKLDNLIFITNYLYLNKINVNTFLLSKNNKFYFEKENFYYALIKINDREKNVIGNDIIKIKINNYLEEYNIIKEINENIIKMGNLANEISSKIIKESYNYFVGLTENALILLNECNENKNYLCHKLEFSNYTKENYNNPIYFIKLNYTYDIANYIKYKFYNQNLNYDEIDNILKQINEINDQTYLFAMMLYQNVYFEYIDKHDEEKIKKIIKFSKEYEKLLIYIKNEFRYNENIKKMDWI